MAAPWSKSSQAKEVFTETTAQCNCQAAPQSMAFKSWVWPLCCCKYEFVHHWVTEPGVEARCHCTPRVPSVTAGVLAEGRSSANLHPFHLGALKAEDEFELLPGQRGRQPCTLRSGWLQLWTGVSSNWLCAHLDLPLKVITTKGIGSTASLGGQRYLLVIG